MREPTDSHGEDDYLSADASHRIARVGAVIAALLLLAGLGALLQTTPDVSPEIAAAGATPYLDVDPAQDDAVAHSEGLGGMEFPL